MKKEKIQLIENAVATNAKKGKLVTTQYVGEYEYKSGFDTFFALGYNDKMEVVVFSCYRNDRHEHLSTDAYKISEVSEKTLDTIIENLNTRNKESRDMIEWEHLDDKYQETLAKLNLFTPKKKRTYEIDVNKIPETKNENDAYRIDRKGNVTILTFVGKKYQGRKSLYLDEEGNSVSLYHSDNAKKGVYSYASKPIKNDAIFLTLSGEEYSQYEYGYVIGSKETLLNLIEASKTTGKYFVVVTDDDNFSAMFMSKVISKAELNKHKGYNVFEKEEDAVKFYNSLIEPCQNEIRGLISTIDEKISKLKEVYKGDLYDIREQLHIRAIDAKPGTYYYITDCRDNSVPSEEVEIVKTDRNVSIDNSEGIAYLSDGQIMDGYLSVYTKDALEKIKSIAADEENTKIGKKIDELTHGRDHLSRMAEYFTPITKYDRMRGIDLKTPREIVNSIQ